MPLIFLLWIAWAGAPMVAQVSAGYEEELQPGVCASSYSKGLEQLRQGQYTEALNSFNSGVRNFQIKDRDPNRACLYGMVGVAYIARLQGDWEKVRKIQQQLSTSMLTSGVDLTSFGYAAELAEFELDQGRPGEAEEIIRRVTKRFGTTVKITNGYLLCQNLLVEAAMDRKDMGAAKEAYQTGQDMWKRQKLTRPDLRMLKGRFERTGARMERMQGNLEEAEKLARSAIATHAKDLAEESWDGIQDKFELGEILYARQQLEEAAKSYQWVYVTIRDRLGKSQPLARRSLTQLEALLRGSGHIESADRVRKVLDSLPAARAL